jgi:hypothetical protein
MFPTKVLVSAGRSFVQSENRWLQYLGDSAKRNGGLRNSAARGGLKHPRPFLTVFLLLKRPNIYIVLT